MLAAVTPTYGPAAVLKTRDLPAPTARAHEVLVKVHASPVTAGDLRLRAADFPSFSAPIGRLMLGLTGPRRPVQGTMFAGRVVMVGAAVSRYAVGDDVFGYTPQGAYAEYLAVPEDGAMARLPAGLGYDEAAAVPYGAGTALHYLRELAAVQPGEKVLIIGASGGVGLFAVQLARHLGAEVTGVCGRRGAALVRSLGADHVIDYAAEDFTESGRRYDVIFDVAGAASFGRCRAALTERGRYLSLVLSTGLLLQAAVSALLGRQRARFAIVMPDRDTLEELRGLLERGAIRPLVARRFPLERIAEAHAEAEGGHLGGSVIVTIAGLGQPPRSAAALHHG